MQSKALFIIASGRPYTSLEKLFWPFEKNVWYTLIGMIFACGFIVMLYNQFGVARNHLSMFDITRILLGLELGRWPVSAISKGLTILIMLNFLVLRNVYQGSLYNFLSNRKNVTPIQTIDEMISDGYTFYIPRRCEYFLSDMSQILSRFINIYIYICWHF